MKVIEHHQILEKQHWNVLYFEVGTMFKRQV